MGKTSQINGKIFEMKLCNYLAKNDYYVIYNEKSASGSQPCDIVAIKNNIPILIECKNLDTKSGIFNLSRIEQNQILAYRKYKECGNCTFILAINWKNSVYLLDFALIKMWDKSIDLKQIEPEFRWGE